MEASACTKIMKALGENTRMQIYERLRNGKLCACEILDQLQITQPTLSHHMKILCDSGIVIAEKDWKWTYYSLDCDKLQALLNYLGNAVCRKSESSSQKNNCG